MMLWVGVYLYFPANAGVIYTISGSFSVCHLNFDLEHYSCIAVTIPSSKYMYLFLVEDLYTHCSATPYLVVVLLIVDGSPHVEFLTSSDVMPISGLYGSGCSEILLIQRIEQVPSSFCQQTIFL